MSERPLERLNYYNGQRLQAADFKLEQDYHIRIRRWLNRSLYSSGIASGLSVYAIKGQPRVRVTPGLAIDHLGREIVLLDEQIVDVVGGRHNNGNGKCGGPYLTIRYQEDVVAEQDASCLTGAHPSNRAAWGGPARILSSAALELNAALPNEESGKIPLACLMLSKGCTAVDAVDAGVRRYIGQGSANKVKQYALEGVRDIDSSNGARIYFHIRGQQPTSVTLYLRAEQMPTLYYTEMGHHTHMNGGSVTVPAHTHGALLPQSTDGTSGPAGAHTPTVTNVLANVDTDVWAGVLGVVGTAAIAGGVTAPLAAALGPAMVGTIVDAAVNPDADLMDLTLSPHFFHSPNDTELAGPRTVNMRITLREEPAHSHTIAEHPAMPLQLGGTGSGGRAGVEDVDPPRYRARTGFPLKYVDALQISVDGNDVTEAARLQVVSNRPTDEDWSRFGTGSADEHHAFIDHGTGPIRVDYLPGVVLDAREHYIDLTVVGDGNGGRIHFNLYVE